MNLNRIIVILVVLIAGIFIAATESNAGKPDKPDRCSPWPSCKDDGGDPPPPPPPTGCTNTFPGFVYTTGGTRKTPAETRLVSSDGCWTESLGGGDMGGGRMHMTADRSKGVLVWVENPGGTNQNIVRRLDFTVDASGNVDAEQPVTILPLAGEEAKPGDNLHYEVGDVWGDANHDSLYITVKRMDSYNSDPNAGASTRVGLIYDLFKWTNVNDSPAVHKFFDQFIPSDGPPEYPSWLDAGGPSDPSDPPDCYSVPYPQFVPTCYVLGYRMTFNASGTRLYLERNLKSELRSAGEVYRGVMRINTEDMAAGFALADWDLAGPELVFASKAGSEGLLPRPGTGIDLYKRPDPEIIASGELFLDADQCADDYDQFAGGNVEPQSSLWQGCIVDDLVGHTGFSNGQVWESANTYLFDRNAKRGRFEIYRMYITGDFVGVEELLIENGQSMDTGL